MAAAVHACLIWESGNVIMDDKWSGSLAFSLKYMRRNILYVVHILCEDEDVI